jgi:hypothetical protein
MKIYDAKNQTFKTYDTSEDDAKDAMRKKLKEQNIPFLENFKGIFIKESDELKIDA